MINRRDALRLLAAGAALPLSSRSLLARALQDARSALGAAPSPRTLNSHQGATVRALCEMILPRTDTPGATDVGAAQFIDLMLTEWYDEPERARFLKGLDDVDARTQALFAKDFVGCSPTQQAQILGRLGEQIAEELERGRDQRRSDTEAASEPSESFYALLRRLTLIAYYTSEAGATAELHFEIIPDHYDGCAEVQSENGGPSRR